MGGDLVSGQQIVNRALGTGMPLGGAVGGWGLPYLGGALAASCLPVPVGQVRTPSLTEPGP